MHQSKEPPRVARSLYLSCRGSLGLDQVADPQPHCLFVRDGVVLSALPATKVDNDAQVVPGTGAVGTGTQVEFQTGTIFCRQRSINEITEQNLIILAVHFYQPLMPRASE